MVPRWVGACFIAGVAAIITAQALLIALPVFWPIGTGLLTIGVVGFVRGSATT